MKYSSIWVSAAILTCSPLAASPPLPVSAANAVQQAAMLKSPNATLAANKKLVYDMWRGFLLAGHVELVDRYFAPGYIQHNPMIETGSAPLKMFAQGRPPLPIPATIPNLVSIVAERDMVTLAFRSELPDPKDASKTYTTTWFDMFRVSGGKIQEHWDGATLPSGASTPVGLPPSEKGQASKN